MATEGEAGVLPASVASPHQPSYREASSSVEIDLWNKNPFEYITDEVKHSYARCSYKWSFHHLPTLFSAIQRQDLDTTLVWAMLAITVR